MTAKDKLEGQRSCRSWIDRASGTKNKSNAVNAAALQRFWWISGAMGVPAR
jgi:hypothetical protein